MNAADVVGYTYNGSFYCSLGCLPDGITSNNEEVNAVFAGDEWDIYPSCDSCGECCDSVGLTPDGFRRMEQDKHAAEIDTAEEHDQD